MSVWVLQSFLVRVCSDPFHVEPTKLCQESHQWRVLYISFSSALLCFYLFIFNNMFARFLFQLKFVYLGNTKSLVILLSSDPPSWVWDKMCKAMPNIFLLKYIFHSCGKTESEQPIEFQGGLRKIKFWPFMISWVLIMLPVLCLQWVLIEFKQGLQSFCWSQDPRVNMLIWSFRIGCWNIFRTEGNWCFYFNLCYREMASGTFNIKKFSSLEKSYKLK